jgi:hypothetical protein
MRQCINPDIYVAETQIVQQFYRKGALFTAAEQRAVAPGAAQKGKECRE